LRASAALASASRRSRSASEGGAELPPRVWPGALGAAEGEGVGLGTVVVLVVADPASVWPWPWK